MLEAASASTGAIVLELLDSASGVPLQTWSFTEQHRILLGRAEESDVVIVNPYVSRSHAYLIRDESGWKAESISSQQLVVAGKRQQSIRLSDGLIFRLGTHGCDLKFTQPKTPANKFNFAGTLMFDPDMCPLLHLDKEQLQREVDQIANDSYFQNLSQAVKNLRSRPEKS